MSNLIIEAISATEKRFSEVAPVHINFKNEQSFAMQLLRNNSYLMSVAEKNPLSLKSAIANIAAIGLSLNPAEKLAYLIPRSVKVGNGWEARVFLEPSYMGLCKLATDSGSIEWVQARCVYSKDKFIDNGLGEKPTHEYEAFSTERGDFVGVYCVAKTKEGDYLTTIMDKEKIHDIRGRSETWKKKPNSGVWHDFFEEQAKKTVVRNAYKMWPRTNSRMAEAVELSNKNEGFEGLETTEPTIQENNSKQKEYFDQLIEQGDSLEMFILKKSLTKDDKSLSQWVNLVHSFPKGKKGYYGDIVKDLTQRGESLFIDIVEGLKEAIGQNDSMAIEELTSDLTNDALDLILEELAPEESHIYNELKAA